MLMLIKIHSEFEKIMLTSKQIFWKNHLGTVYGDMIHEGYYFEPLVKNLEALIDSVNEDIKGIVKVSVCQGELKILSMESPYSLFRESLGSYGEMMTKWSGKDAESYAKFHNLEGVNAFLVKNNK
jgi:argininosuccinate synthase